MLRSAFVGMVKSSLGLPLVGVPTPKVRWYTEGAKLPVRRSGNFADAVQASLPPSAGTIVQCGPAARFMSSRASPIFGSPSSMVRAQSCELLAVMCLMYFASRSRRSVLCGDRSCNQSQVLPPLGQTCSMPSACVPAQADFPAGHHGSRDKRGERVRPWHARKAFTYHINPYLKCLGAVYSLVVTLGNRGDWAYMLSSSL